jgi:hypothetical protein
MLYFFIGYWLKPKQPALTHPFGFKLITKTMHYYTIIHIVERGSLLLIR